MSRIKDSTPCTKSELDLFYTLPTNTSIIRSNNIQYLSDKNNSHDNFEIILTRSSEYTDLNEIFLQLDIEIPGFNDEKIKIENEKKEIVEEARECSIINNLGHSLFDRIEFKLSYDQKPDVAIEFDPHYYYKAYLLNLLNYSDEIKNTYLQNGIWEKDEANKFDLITNTGYTNRKNIFKECKEKYTLFFPLHIDFLNSNRLLIPKVDLKFKFVRSDNKFLFMGKHYNKMTLNINKASLWCRRCEITSDVVDAHNYAILSSPVKYPFKQNKIITHNVDNGLKEFTAKTTYTYTPNKIVSGFVLDSAFNGDEKNPYNFQHFHVEEIIYTVDSQITTLKMNPEINDCSHVYNSIFQSLNILNQGSNGITKNDFLGGNCLFCFNLNPDKGCDDQFNQLKTSQVSITFKFSKNTPAKLKLISLLEYDNQININNKGEISFDYQLA